MDNKRTSLIIAVIITALVVGGGTYFWQHSNMVKLENENLGQKAQLQQQIDNLNEQIDNLNAQLNPPTPERYIKVISPNGGEKLCLDDDFAISWESKGVSLITVSVITLEAGGSGSYPLETVSANSSETGNLGEGKYIWEVGHARGGILLKKGVNYKINISSADGILIGDSSDNAFEILLCKE